MRITAAASVLILAALSVTAIPIELHQHHRRGLGDVVNGVKETGAKLWEKLQTIIHRPPKTPTNLPKPVEALHAPEQAIVPVRAPGQPIAPNVASDVAAPKVASNVAAPKVASNVAAPVGDAASVANKAPTKVGFLQKLTSPFKSQWWRASPALLLGVPLRVPSLAMKWRRPLPVPTRMRAEIPTRMRVEIPTWMRAEIPPRAMGPQIPLTVVLERR